MADERPIEHVFTVRGRPVGYRSSHFGGEVVATLRGYFPISSTGYRSLPGHLGSERFAPGSLASEEFFEGLALEQDKDRRATIARVSRAPRVGSDRLANFISASGDATKAINDGFFAPDADRAVLWQGAYRLLCLIDTDIRFQPAPNDHAWTEEHCAVRLGQSRAQLTFVRQLAAGDFPAEPPAGLLTLHSYFDLPPKPGGEPGIELPAITPEFSLGLSADVPGQDEDEEMEVDARMRGPAPDDTPDETAQMKLF